ncbi:MAG: diguanylate cyclase [Anaerolineales bacterium]|nr:diguanylate cyclase [Anaerolineales bacterium]
MNLQIYHGLYYMMGFALDVQDRDGALTAAVPGVPKGYEIILTPLAEDTFQLHGGPLDNAPLTFTRNDAGEITGATVAHYEFAKIPPEKATLFPIAARYPGPVLTLTPEKEAAFQHLLDAINAQPSSDWLPYDLLYPKHEFIQFLMARDLFIFHGSNKQDIETFVPIRTSVELYDKRGIGNLPAIYGTHDGLWAMFFAIVNRGQIRGSIRNGVAYFHNHAGEPLAIYNFSINQEQLPEKPWTEGALYFFSRDKFERQRFTETNYANEWACTESLTPLAKLHLHPEDFPFLNQIYGHDDSILEKAGKLSTAVRQIALAASLNGDHFTLTVPHTPENLHLLTEFQDVQQTFIPAANISITPSGDHLFFTIQNLPPAYQHVYTDTYKDLLDA